MAKESDQKPDGGYTKEIKARVSPAHVARFKALQSDAAMSGSELVRRWIDGRNVESRIDLACIAEMRKQGGLLKHLGYAALQDGVPDGERLIKIGQKILTLAQEVRDGLKKN